MAIWLHTNGIRLSFSLVLVMRDSKSRNNEEQKPAITPRRSPRFLHQNQTGRGNEWIPNPRIRQRGEPTFLIHLPHLSAPQLPNPSREGIDLQSRKLWWNLEKGSKMPPRLDRGANLSGLDLPKQSMTEKMVTRSSVCQADLRIDWTTCLWDFKDEG